MTWRHNVTASHKWKINNIFELSDLKTLSHHKSMLNHSNIQWFLKLLRAKPYFKMAAGYYLELQEPATNASLVPKILFIPVLFPFVTTYYTTCHHWNCHGKSFLNHCSQTNKDIEGGGQNNSWSSNSDLVIALINELLVIYYVYSLGIELTSAITYGLINFDRLIYIYYWLKERYTVCTLYTVSMVFYILCLYLWSIVHSTICNFYRFTST